MTVEQMEIPGTEPTQLDQALALGDELTRLRLEMEELENQRKSLQEKYNQIEQNLLPDLFNQLGIDEIRLQNGVKIKLHEFPTGRLTKETKDAAFQWLREHNLDAIIKNSFDIRLNRGEDQQARELQEFLQQNHMEFQTKEDIHPSTLKAFIREQAEDPEFPRDLFNVYEVKQVKFTG